VNTEVLKMNRELLNALTPTTPFEKSKKVVGNTLSACVVLQSLMSHDSPDFIN
jgi:hypothetical protein